MIKPIDPNCDPDDIPRLAGQSAKILEMLIEKPRLNRS